MDFKNVKLKYPIPFKAKDGLVINMASLNIGRLKAKHLKYLPENTETLKPSELLPLIAALCEIPIETAEELDIEDLNSVSSALTDIMGNMLSPDSGKR
jgi:hypothetical protein